VGDQGAQGESLTANRKPPRIKSGEAFAEIMRQITTDAMIPFWKISSGFAWRCAMPCS
jgi:hypothetical protein